MPALAENAQNGETWITKTKRRGSVAVGIVTGAYVSYKFGDAALEQLSFMGLPDGICPEGTFSVGPTSTCEYEEGYGPTSSGLAKTAIAAVISVGSMIYTTRIGK